MRGPSIGRLSRSQGSERFTFTLSELHAKQLRERATNRGMSPGLLIREIVVQELNRDDNPSEDVSQ
jgi:hypothetical protein